VQDADPGTSGVQIIPGDFLDPINRLEITEITTETGEIDYAVSQRYPAEERTGSGLLATVVFEAVGLGTSPVDLVEVRLLDDTPLDPVEIAADLYDGEVTVVSPVYLPLVLQSGSS